MKLFNFSILFIVLIQILKYKCEDIIGNQGEFYVKHDNLPAGHILTNEWGKTYIHQIKITLFNVNKNNKNSTPIIMLQDSNEKINGIYQSGFKDDSPTTAEFLFGISIGCGTRVFNITIGDQSCQSKFEYYLPQVSCSFYKLYEYRRSDGQCYSTQEGLRVEFEISNRKFQWGIWSPGSPKESNWVPDDIKGGIVNVNVCNTTIYSFETASYLVYASHMLPGTRFEWKQHEVSSKKNYIEINGYFFNEKVANSSYIVCPIQNNIINSDTSSNTIIQEKSDNVSNNTTINRCTFENANVIKCNISLLSFGPIGNQCELHFNEGNEGRSVVTANIRFVLPNILRPKFQISKDKTFLTIDVEYFEFYNVSVYVNFIHCNDLEFKEKYGGSSITCWIENFNEPVPDWVDIHVSVGGIIGSKRVQFINSTDSSSSNDSSSKLTGYFGTTLSNTVSESQSSDSFAESQSMIYLSI